MNGCIKLCITAYVAYLASGVSFRDVTVPYGLDSMEALGRFVGFGDFNQDRGTDILLTNGMLEPPTHGCLVLISLWCYRVYVVLVVHVHGCTCACTVCAP